MELTPDEKERIYLEEKARLEGRKRAEAELATRRKKEQEEAKRAGSHRLRNWGIGITVVLILWLSNKPSSTPTVSTPSVPTATASFVASKNPAHDSLIAMTDGKRNFMLTKFLKGSEEDCDTVVRNFYQGGVDGSGKAHWNAACRNGKAYDIMIEPDAMGSTKILDCAMIAFLKATPCFQKF